MLRSWLGQEEQLSSAARSVTDEAVPPENPIQRESLSNQRRAEQLRSRESRLPTGADSIVSFHLNRSVA